MVAATVRLFVSYAAEDEQDGRKIAAWFRHEGFDVYHWQDPRQRGGRFIEEIEKAILQADAFLLLLSRNYLASPWCRLERELAMLRDIDLRDSVPTFIHVLMIADTPFSGAGFLRIWDSVNLTRRATRQRELSALADRLRSARATARRDDRADALESTRHAALQPRLGAPLFHNRHDELEMLRHGLTNAGGPHFWLVSAPPQLGKTWFLNRLSAQLITDESSPWVARLVDVRELPDAVRSNAMALLASLFGLSTWPAVELDTLVGISREVCRKGRSHLCLLDSAELLTDDTATALRSYLGQIYDLVQESGPVDVRIGLVVASRHDDQWRGVIPYPRLFALRLTEFKVDVVHQALRDLADQTRRQFPPTQLRRIAARVHHLSEGLPALLVQCLQWIRQEQWLGLTRLQSRELFERFAEPYIKEGLMSDDSLFREGQGEPGEARRALEHAFRILATYRLFTQAHLQHHRESDSGFRRILDDRGWSVEDLWAAISATALLKRPLDEPWQEIHKPIRRLLYRYYFRSDEQRAAAHREARMFVGVWADGQTGKEQAIGLVECLWHEAGVLRFTRDAQMANTLSETATKLSQALRPSALYKVEDLQRYAAERMREDEEFREALRDVPGLFDRLVVIVKAPS